MERYLPTYRTLFFEEEDLKFVFPGRREGKRTGFNGGRRFYFGGFAGCTGTGLNGASSVSRGSKVVLNQGEREGGIRGRKKKKAIVVRISYIDCSYIFFHRILACQREKKIQFFRSEFCAYYTVQVGQCTT